MIISEHNRNRCHLFSMCVFFYFLQKTTTTRKIVCDFSFSALIYMETIQYCLFRYFCHSSKSFSFVWISSFQGKRLKCAYKIKICNEMIQNMKKVGNTYAMSATIMHGIYFQWDVITTSTTFHFMHSLQCRESHTRVILFKTSKTIIKYKYINRLKKKSRCQTAITT